MGGKDAQDQMRTQTDDDFRLSLSAALIVLSPPFRHGMTSPPSSRPRLPPAVSFPGAFRVHGQASWGRGLETERRHTVTPYQQRELDPSAPHSRQWGLEGRGELGSGPLFKTWRSSCGSF